MNSIYVYKQCKLYYGFLQEHGASFTRIISADISVKKDAFILVKAIKDPIVNMLIDELIDEHLLHVYIRSHIYDVNGSLLPEANKYLSSNKTMMKLPSIHCAWEKSHINDCEYIRLLMQIYALWPTQLPYLSKSANEKG